MTTLDPTASMPSPHALPATLRFAPALFAGMLFLASETVLSNRLGKVRV